MRVLGSSAMHVKNPRSRRCSQKMERTSVNLTDVPSFQRITMESRLHSSGRFSQEPQLRNFSKKFKKTLKDNAWSFSDRTIFMSMFNDIDLDKKETLAVSIREKSKSMRQDSLTDTGYSWVPEKKASGIKDMQSIVAHGYSVLHQLWRNSRILETRYSKG